MTTYINELLQETLNSKEDYMGLAKSIYMYITQNSEDKYSYIVDAMQMLIFNKTNKFLLYSDVEVMYFAIKGFESIYK
jgi:hypothetical protein